MRSDTNQLDVFRDDPKRMAQVNRTYADMWLHNLFYPEEERKLRYEMYMRKAEEIEGGLK